MYQITFYVLKFGYLFMLYWTCIFVWNKTSINAVGFLELTPWFSEKFELYCFTPRSFRRPIRRPSWHNKSTRRSLRPLALLFDKPMACHFIHKSMMKYCFHFFICIIVDEKIAVYLYLSSRFVFFQVRAINISFQLWPMLCSPMNRYSSETQAKIRDLWMISLSNISKPLLLSPFIIYARAENFSH